MKGYLNLKLLELETFDSGSLSCFVTVVRQFVKEGNYKISVNKNRKTEKIISLIVDPTCDIKQKDIDLTASDSVLASENNKISPNGYVCFCASKGLGGYSVKVTKSDKRTKKREFDSTVLNKGDMFVTSIIKPGTYSITNMQNNSIGKMEVKYPIVKKEPYSPPEPIVIECGKKIYPNKITLKPAQGAIFKIIERSRIKITLLKANDGNNKPVRPRKRRPKYNM